MVLWALAIFLALSGVKALFADPDLGLAWLGLSREKRALAAVTALLLELEESLLSGVLPAQTRWAALETLPAPWGRLAAESLRELRAQGASLLPTLRRLRQLSQDHAAALTQARSKSAQATAQAGICAALVPIFSLTLEALLPGLRERATPWLLLSFGAFCFSLLGSLWLYRISQAARWGGLSGAERGWVLVAQCGGERMLALIRAGTPADLAWSKTQELVAAEAPALAAAWGFSVWNGGWKGADPPHRSQNGLREALFEAGYALRKAVQVSLMEGRACTDRVEMSLSALKQEIRSAIDRELTLVSTRALKPLFLCVAPPLLFLLACGFFLSWTESGGGLGL